MKTHARAGAGSNVLGVHVLRRAATPTFLQRLAHFDVAVGSLELVEERADLKVVADPFAELRHHGAVLPGGADLEHGPLAPLRPLRRRPVHHLVALDVLRLLLHLVDSKDAPRICQRALIPSAWIQFAVQY